MLFHSIPVFEDALECRRTIRREIRRLHAQGKRNHSVPSWHWDKSKGFVFSLAEDKEK